ERIRALGELALGSYRAYATLTTIAEEDDVPSAEDMLKNLVAGQEQVVRTAREVFTRADNANDQPTADLQCTKRPRGCCARCSPEPGLQRIERVTSVGAGRRSDQRSNQGHG